VDTGRKVGERAGYTLVELMLTMFLVGVLTAVAIPQFVRFQDRARVTHVILHLKIISDALEIYGAENGTPPLSLVDFAPELAALTDRWGTPYNYTRVEGAKIGKLRKNKFLVPINSDYDLWSNGPDGRTVMALTAKHSRDDIIRAGDGSYFGRAAGY
jgi:general secretion pathway protein G